MFSANLKKIRITKGINQKELAKILNVSYKTVSHWESVYSRPSYEILTKLKYTLSVSYEELLEDNLI